MAEKKKAGIRKTLFHALFEAPVEKRRRGKTEEVLEARVLEDGAPIKKRKRKSAKEVAEETKKLDKLIKKSLDEQERVTQKLKKRVDGDSEPPKRKRIRRAPNKPLKGLEEIVAEEALSDEPKEKLEDVAEALEEEVEWPEPEEIAPPEEEADKGLLNRFTQQTEKEPEDTDSFWDGSQYDLGEEEIPDDEEDVTKGKGKRKKPEK